MEASYKWIGSILIIILATGGYLYFQSTGTKDLCADNLIWQPANITNLYYCPSENTYQWCLKLSDTKRTCYLLEQIQVPEDFKFKELNYTSITTDIKEEVVRDDFTEHRIVNKSKPELGIVDIQGEFKSDFDYKYRIIGLDGKRYTWNEGVSIRQIDVDKYVFETKDGVSCNFDWKNYDKGLKSSSINSYSFDGKIENLVCNQQLIQISPDLYKINHYLIKLDPEFIDDVQANFTLGTFNFTRTDDENITLIG